MQYLSNASSFLSDTIFTFAIYIVLIRFWMQWVNASFRNPLGQFTITVTDPIILPLRKLFPNINTIDIASIFAAYILSVLKILIVLSLNNYGYPYNWIGLALYCLGSIIKYSIYIFIASIIIQAIASWINPYQHNPIITIAHQISEPLLAPARKIIPPISGVDVSPILTLIFLQLSLYLIVEPLQSF